MTTTILERLYAMERPSGIAWLMRDYALFCAAMEEILGSEGPPIVPASPHPEEQTVCRMAHDLREQGVAFLRGHFSDTAVLEEARRFARVVKARADKFQVSEKTVADQEMGGLLWARSTGGWNTRVSFQAQRVPPVLLPFVRDRMFEPVIQRAIGSNAPIEPVNIIVDYLRPTDEYEFQWWHYDRIRNQYKMMILLDDIDEHNGPMKIVPGTHKWIDKRKLTDFACFNSGPDFADVNYGVYSSYRNETVLVTGKAGDVVLFDTRAFHAHGRPATGDRMTATIYFSALNTPLNGFLTDFNPPGVNV